MRRTNVVICGAEGRMGKLLVACAKKDPALSIVGTVDSGDDLAEVISPADVIIDFTTHTASLALARIAASHKKALVIGTTGHSGSERAAIVETVRGIPVVFSANFSTGVNVLFYVTRLVGELLKDADVDISETHHTKKKDAPSGTAKRLQEILEAVRGRDVPVHSLRIGEVVGDHTVAFTTPDERLELTHRAIDRATFARGALRAAKWAVTQKAGLYDMQDVLGLKK